jgi:ubiquinone/menaquinone biosynthesis C-methylase UbiE
VIDTKGPELTYLLRQAEKARGCITAFINEMSEVETVDTVNPYEGSLASYVARYQLSKEELADALPDVRVSTVTLTRRAYEQFLSDILPSHASISANVDHKKKLELFISYSLLNIHPSSTFLDAAGGGFSYAGHLSCAKSYLQDLEIRDSVRRRIGDGVTYVEASMSNIPLDDSSVDAISCHHAFEHFQGTADTDFIKEAQRILRPGGALVIVPIFLSRAHVELTNVSEFTNWSAPEKVRLYDPGATLPGTKSGSFARVYDLEAFKDRVLAHIDSRQMTMEIIEPTMGGISLPDPRNYVAHKISNFNFPYRAFRMTKKTIGRY